MTAEKRMPGPVEAKASPINKTVAEERQHLDEGMIAPAHRTSGPVSEQTETVDAKTDTDVVADSIMLQEMTASSPWKMFFTLLVCTFFIWLLSATVANLLKAYREQIIWVWLPLTVMSCVLLVAFLWAVHREYRAIRAVDALAERETQIQRMIEDQNLSGLHIVLSSTLKNLRKRYPGLIYEFESAAAERETPEEYLNQFDNIVLTQLDKEAQKVIKRNVLTGSTAVAISPHPALDSFLVLWRAKILIRTIGEIYGLQPTGLSSIRLIKYAITSAMIAASLETTGEVVLTQAAQSVALEAVKPLAEGATTAARLYRLGKSTQQVCRPISTTSK
jgi:putative membrane protein